MLGHWPILKNAIKSKISNRNENRASLNSRGSYVTAVLNSWQQK